MAPNWWKKRPSEPSSFDNSPVHQPLTWTEEETRKFHQWKLEAAFQPYWNLLQQGLEAELQTNGQGLPNVSFWKGQGAEGLLFFFDRHPGKVAEAKFLFRYCGDRIKELGYTIQLQDYKKEINGLELLRYYFKPSLKSKLDQVGLPWSQIYGNLLLELSLVNGLPETLKIQANSFQDRQYQKVKHFYDFVTQLMQ